LSVAFDGSSGEIKSSSLSSRLPDDDVDDCHQLARTQLHCNTSTITYASWKPQNILPSEVGQLEEFANRWRKRRERGELFKYFRFISKDSGTGLGARVVCLGEQLFGW
jgi:hypothetical protein